MNRAPDYERVARLLAELFEALGQTGGKDPDELLPTKIAAKEAGTSDRVIREAILAGDLRGYGGKRDRAVRRRDLHVWIESRLYIVKDAPVDLDLERRMRRISKEQKEKRAK